MQIFGSLWYYFSILRNFECWEHACQSNRSCRSIFLYCGHEKEAGYKNWLKHQNVTIFSCSIDNKKREFDYGIYTNAIETKIVESYDFISKFCYCLWWGLQNMRCISLFGCILYLCIKLKSSLLHV